MSQSKRTVLTPLVLIGLAFFFNPLLGALDVLPDFIGCLLVVLGISRATKISPVLAQASASFLKVAAVDLGRLIALAVVFGLGTAAERPTSILIVAFAAAILQLYFVFPAITNLFDGISLLAMGEDCAALYGTVKKGRSRTELISRATVLFLCLREGICLLPEFSALSTSAYTDSLMIRIYDYISFMRFVAVSVVLVLGIVWLCRLVSFFKLFGAQNELHEALGRKYADFLASHPGFTVLRRHAIAFALLGVGAVLLPDFYIDHYDVLPDALGGILILAGILLLARSAQGFRPAGIAALCYVAFSAASTRLSRYFVQSYTGSEIVKNELAARAYLAMWLVALAEFLCFLVLLAFLLLFIRRIVLARAGYISQRGDEAFEQRRLAALHNEFDGQLIKCFAFGFISALFSFIYDYMQELPNIKYLRFLEFFWFYDFVIALAFAIYFISVLSHVYGRMQDRFMFD